ncbi:glycosyltransferase family 4 protein [Thalassospira alkalitolerans]|uniref:glycosyltransferase family 4 protein n=1 Tax=Thalassospira alkalitolerans TaxID=1293890 RepID=UPI003AA961A2
MHQLVILDDRISDWEVKGEIQPGYFNPCGMFDHITIVSLWQDTPSEDAIIRLCQPAEPHFIALGHSRTRLTLLTLGLRPFLLQLVLREFIKTTKAMAPDIIRCYGESLGTVTGGLLKTILGIPLAVSLHTTPAPEILKQFSTWRDRVWRAMINNSCKKALGIADAIIAVYSPILDYLPAQARAKATVIPNCVATNPAPIKRKSGTEFNVLWVGRLIPGRDPTPILDAISMLNDSKLTIVGNGPLAEQVEQHITTHELADRIKIIPSIDNAHLVQMLGEFDAMALQTDYFEIAKPVIEASLAGLPVVINQSPSASIDEYRQLPVIFVDGRTNDYYAALAKLKNDIPYWQRTSQNLKEAAWLHWSPDAINSAMAKILDTATKYNPTGKHK